MPRIAILLLAVSLLFAATPGAHAQFPFGLGGKRDNPRDTNRDNPRDAAARDDAPPRLRDMLRKNGRSDARQEALDQAHADIDTAYQGGHYDKVVALADQLLQTEPTDHVAYHMRASAKIELGRIAGDNKQVRDGIADSRQALALAGLEHAWLYIPYLYGLTSLAEIEKRPDHAALAVKVAGPVIQRPGVSATDQGNLLYQRGLAYEVQKDTPHAAADFKETISLSRDHLAAHLELARAYAAGGQKDAALAAYDSAVSAFSNNALLVNDRGAYRRTSGDLDGAMSDFTRATQIDPKFSMGYVNRGVCLIEQNEPMAAEGDFDQALALAPRTAMAHRLRGTARLMQGKLPEAIKDYTDALNLAPQDLAVREERGFARFFQKDYTGAAADFQEALRRAPQLRHLAPWQSLAQTRAGKADAAAVALSAVKPAAGSPDWVTSLARFLRAEISDQELLDAAKAPNTSLQTSRVCEAHYFIGQKQALAGAQDQAAEHYRECLATRAFMLAAYRGARYELKDFSTR